MSGQSLKFKVGSLQFSPWLILAGALLLTTLAAYHVLRAASAEERFRFEAQATEVERSIESAMETYIACLRGTAGLFAASDYVTHADFRSYVDKLEIRTRYPGIQGIGFCKRIEHADLEGQILEARKEHPDFQVASVPPHNEYHVVLMIQPFDERNKASLGFDMFSEPTRRKAMEQARDSGAPVASGRVILMQEIDERKQPGFIVYLPVYKTTTIPQTVEERRAHLVGFVYSPFRVHDLLEKTVKQALSETLNFMVYDSSSYSAADAIFVSGKADRAAQLHTQRNVEIAGQVWEVQFSRSRSSWIFSHRDELLAIILPGLLFSILLFGAARSQVVARGLTEEALVSLRASEEELKKSRDGLEIRVEQRTEELAQTVAQLEQNNTQMASMTSLSDQLEACMTMEEAFKVIQHFGLKFFPGYSAAIFLYNASRNNLELVVSWGGHSRVTNSFSPVDCWALRRGRPHYTEYSSRELACPHFPAGVEGEFLCVPMTGHGDTIGLLEMIKPGQEKLGEPEQKLAQTVAEHVALVLANLRLRAELYNQTVRDPLTGLFNRRYLEESFERELHRTIRNKEPLSVMMLDLDHFKSFNDTFGHEAGDSVLSMLGEVLRKTLRAEDIACRYGGEEFTLLLPGAGLEDAQKRAEDVLSQIRQSELRPHGELTRRITASIGVATFPMHGINPTELMRAADRALYEAKGAGRDRCMIAKLGDKTDESSDAPAAI